MKQGAVTETASTLVRVLGRATVRDALGLDRPVERKTAALLAYLTVEGHASRARLTSLLWPDTREDAARNNLVHLLRKLTALAGTPLVEGRETLALHPDVRVDLHTLLPGSEAPGGAPPTGRLLCTHDFDDCPELDEWLRAERERLEEWQLIGLREHATTLEAQGAHDAALSVVLRLLDLDPYSEDAHRRLMRLHARMGNRHRALRAYERLCEVLRHELGVEPLPETVSLARSLRPAPALSVRSASPVPA
ncbi:AfsR/SARP family transcriptional regulator [Deinococcus pimensis]|uniref:AfsR/SARP family transcriptional regulator n=1 Tax=Deinococcus pimensis TaxID=309888 RepID=UPI000486481C|nr:BTAD domain-containing putative transcriptional regulator [Deinococcus pimensis]